MNRGHRGVDLHDFAYLVQIFFSFLIVIESNQELTNAEKQSKENPAPIMGQISIHVCLLSESANMR